MSARTAGGGVPHACAVQAGGAGAAYWNSFIACGALNTSPSRGGPSHAQPEDGDLTLLVGCTGSMVDMQESLGALGDSEAPVMRCLSPTR